MWFLKKYKKGFTLMELIIVMIIISILVLLATPKFMVYLEDAKKAQIENDVRVVEDTLMLEYITNDNNIKNDLIDKDNKITDNIMDQVNTSLDKDKFYYINNKVVYLDNNSLDNTVNEDNDLVVSNNDYNANINTNTNNQNIKPEDLIIEDVVNENPLIPNISSEIKPEEIKDEISREDYEKAKNIFKYTVSENKEIIVYGLKDEYMYEQVNINWLKNLEYNGDRIVEIYEEAFHMNNNLYGEIPQLKYLKKIGRISFQGSSINGKLPYLENLEVIDRSAFGWTELSGELPFLPNLKEIKPQAFQFTKLNGELPNLPRLKTIGSAAFANTQIAGNFPAFPKLRFIEQQAFEGTQISGQLPYMPNLEYIYGWAFVNTQLDQKQSNYPYINFLNGDEWGRY